MPRSAISFAGVLVLGLFIFVGGLALAQGVRAQSYPPPAGSLSVEAASTTPGSTTDVTATVLDNSGNPVEGAEVIFRITSQPGSDAAWANGKLETTGITNANGVATAVLAAGSELGNITIETISGEKTSQVTVAVQEVGLPPTGGSAPAEESGVSSWQIALLAIGGAALVAGLVIMVRRSKRA